MFLFPSIGGRVLPDTSRRRSWFFCPAPADLLPIAPVGGRLPITTRRSFHAWQGSRRASLPVLSRRPQRSDPLFGRTAREASRPPLPPATGREPLPYAGSREPVEKRLRLPQVGGIEPFGEP